MYLPHLLNRSLGSHSFCLLIGTWSIDLLFSLKNVQVFVLREAILKKGLSEVMVGTVQQGLGYSVRADELGAVGTSEAGGASASLTMGHPGQTPVRQGSKPRYCIQY